jgi:hypothetical protein
MSNWIACSSDKGTIHIFTVSKNMTRIQLSDENKEEELAAQQKKDFPSEADQNPDGKQPKNSKHV